MNTLAILAGKSMMEDNVILIAMIITHWMMKNWNMDRMIKEENYECQFI